MTMVTNFAGGVKSASCVASEAAGTKSLQRNQRWAFRAARVAHGPSLWATTRVRSEYFGVDASKR